MGTFPGNIISLFWDGCLLVGIVLIVRWIWNHL